MANWPGWETVRLIGKGSFGAVYEIQRDVMGETEKAALKVISIPKDTNDIDELYSEGFDNESITNKYEEHLKSIIAEYTMMRKMSDCVNVVSCDDVHYERQENGIGWNIFIKMELLTPLLKTLDNAMTETEVIKFAKDICKALCACQKLNIIHRDIKPQNIFVSKNGDYKLGDFGIAKAVDKTSYGTYAGTEKYMAPEVYANKPYGATADIYSLGLVIYWLLNNRRFPFLPAYSQKITFSMDEDARIRRLSGEKIPSPVNGSDALKSIVLKACAYNTQDRYSSAEEMLTALKNIGRYKNANKNEKENKNTANSDATLSNKILNHIVFDFKTKNNVDLLMDNMAVKRVLEAIANNMGRIKNGERVLISLPYITATSNGPFHLEMHVSIDDVIDNYSSNNAFKNISIKEIISKADRGNIEAMLEVVCRYCIEMHKKASGINITDDMSFKNELNKKLSKVINQIKNGSITFLRTEIDTIKFGKQAVSVDLTWQNARDYMVLLGTLNDNEIKTIISDAENNAAIAFTKQDFKQSIKYCLTVLSYNSRSVDILNILGKCYREMNRSDIALECYKKAIALSPGKSVTYGNAAIACYTMNQTEEAKQYILKAIEFAEPEDSNYPAFFANYALIEAKLGNKKGAESLLEKAKVAGYTKCEDIKQIINSSEVRGKQYNIKINNKTKNKMVKTKKSSSTINKSTQGEVKLYSGNTAIVITALLGWLGVHRFITRKYITGIIWFFTCGGFFVGWIIDLINVRLGKFAYKESQRSEKH